MKKMQRIVAIAGALLFLLLLPLEAGAISYGGVGGEPANPQPDNPRTKSIFIYELKPGQSASDGVKVLNDTNKTQTINLFAVDSVLSSGGEFGCAQNSDPKHDVGSWIQLGSSSITLGPNSSQVVPFTVTVPNSPNISVGEHDGCIALQAASETATNSGHSGVVLSFRSAIRVVVTIPGKIIKSLKIDNVQYSGIKNSNYIISSYETNNGNVSLDVNLQTRLEPLIGSSITAPKSTAPVLPRTSSMQQTEIKRQFWGGLYRVHLIAEFNSNPSTQLGLGGASNQKVITRDSSLFYAPPTVLGGLIELAIALIIIALIVLFVRRYRHVKHVDRHWQPYTVKGRDTLDSLAKKSGVSWRKIASTNKLKPPYTLEKGQTIKLPVIDKK